MRALKMRRQLRVNLVIVSSDRRTSFFFVKKSIKFTVENAEEMI